MPGVPGPEQMSNSRPPRTKFVSNARGLPGGVVTFGFDSYIIATVEDRCKHEVKA